MAEQQDPFPLLTQAYRVLVRSRHPAEELRWPVLSGADVCYASFQDWSIVFLRHTGNPGMINSSDQGELPPSVVGVSAITVENREQVRDRLLRHFRARIDDAVILGPKGQIPSAEFERMLTRHEAALGLAKMRIFLSHKSADKAFVRDFKATLESLGLDPWLDEDAMPAGTQLDRGILKGMEDSCAAVFFLTPEFADEAFLASEINYAIDQQRLRPQQFSIISLVFGDDGKRPNVPGLLRAFVWKEPKSPLDALREIVRALPIKVGPPHWR